LKQARSPKSPPLSFSFYCFHNKKDQKKKKKEEEKPHFIFFFFFQEEEIENPLKLDQKTRPPPLSPPFF
jgi:hypothetical protein